MSYVRPQVAELEKALSGRVPLLQVVVGPRQVGKSMAAFQLSQQLGWPVILDSADSALPLSVEWISNHWRQARQAAKGGKMLLVLDEIQKVPGWSEEVKRLWDEDRRTGSLVRPLLLGSSALLMQQGLTESLAGRFFLHRFLHWTWPECRQAFGLNFEQWLYFGGYPGAAEFVGDEPMWKRYVVDSLIETVVARDVLQLQVVHKPALLRQLFALAGTFPAQIFSYNKMLGQLHDAGNTTTLAHYLQLLETAFLATGLEMFSKGKLRRRGSSPKLILWNNALVNAPALRTFNQAQADGSWRGRLVENAVGAKLLSELQGTSWSVSYWRDGDQEMDFVVSSGEAVWGIEVKSGRSGKTPGIGAFKQAYPEAKLLLIGAGGVPLEEFFERPAPEWLG